MTDHAESRVRPALLGSAAFALAYCALLWTTAGWLDDVQRLPDQGASWYYWKLANPTFWSRLSAWGLYTLHQASNFALIAYAQLRVGKYTHGLHRVNRIALAMNAGFALLHWAQTQVFYDGLAQDVSIWSSLGSVAFLLIWVLLMEDSRRGLFFGRKVFGPGDITRFARRYHGYVFSWAIVYTFWYHPTEATFGHLAGFFYMGLLLAQGSLFFTRTHTNRVWTLLLEVMVLAHGTLVALQQGNTMWPMFAFGFGAIFIVTQMHGVGLSRMERWAIAIVYLLLALGVYARVGIVRIHEVARIPLIDYVSVFVLAGLIAAGLRVTRWFRTRGAAAPQVRGT